MFFVPLMNGYIVRIYSGEDTLPEINNWGKLFIDGWKYNIIAILYLIPAIIVAVVLAFFTLLSVSEIIAVVSGGNTAGIIALVTGVFTALLIMLIILVIISLFLIIALVRFGKTGKIGEAFNFGAINKQISGGVGRLLRLYHTSLDTRTYPDTGPVCNRYPSSSARDPCHHPDTTGMECIRRKIRHKYL